MAKKKPSIRTVARSAPVAPTTINFTQHIDARGVGEAVLPPLREILMRAADQARADIARMLAGSAPVARAARVPDYSAVRFWKVAASGYVATDDAKDWEGVYDASTNLIWSRKLLAGEHEWKKAIEVAAAATLCGAPARAPTIQERLSIVDYSRVEPALDIRFFDPKETSGWEWTSTPAAAPSGYAWLVYLGVGHSNRYYQGTRSPVRAVRAGQPLGFEF